MFDPISFLIKLVIGVVLSAVSTLWSQANKVEQQKKTGTRGTSQVGGKVPQSFLVGTVGDPGKLVYPRSTWGNSGEVPNAYLTTILSFGGLPVTAMTGLFVSSSAVTLTTAVSAAQGYAVPEYQIGGADHLWHSFERGVQTSASPFLMSKFGANPEYPWTSDMVGRGVPYLATTMLWGDGVWASATPPIVGQFQGIALYDIRKDSTRGGSGAHRWAGDTPTPAEQATWEFSDNNMVIAYNLLRGVFYNGQRVWGGRCTAAQLPYGHWADAMGSCDVPVSLVGGGTEKQFRGGRKIYVNEEPRNVINEFLVGCNGRIAYASDGTVYPLVGVPAVADGAFTDADVLGTEPLGSIPLPRLDEIINGATATYREPSHAWEPKETAPHYRSDLEDEDDGRRQTEGLSLDTTFSGTQAQRVLKATVEEARRFGRHVVALRAPFAQFRPLQTLEWTSERFGYESKLFLITVRTRPIWGWVVFGLQEIDPTDHAWTPGTDERPLSFAPVVTNRPAPQEVSGFYVAPAIANDSQGRPRRTAIDAFWSAASVTVDVRAVRITVRVDDGGPAGSGELAWEGEAPVPISGSARLTENLVGDSDYVVQIEYMPHSGRATVASSWLPVTTPDVKLTGLDVDLGDLAEDIGNSISEREDWARFNTRETIEEKRRAILLNAAGAIGDYNDRQIIRREASSQSLANKAQWTEDIFTATGPGSAIVQRIEELRAEVFDPVSGLPATAEVVDLLSAEVHDPGTGLEAIGNSILSLNSTVGQFSADGLLRVQTVANTSGAATTIALGAAASDGANMGNAALYLRGMSDGSSDAFVVANRFAVKSSPSGALFGLFAVEGGVVFIDDAMIRNASIGTAKIADAAITRAKIGNLAVGAAQIDALAVTTAKIGDLAVDTLKLADGAVTATVSQTAPNGTVNFSTPHSLNLSFSSYATGVIQIVTQFRIPTRVFNAYQAFPVIVTLRRGATVLRQQPAWPVVAAAGEEYDQLIFQDNWYGFTFIDTPPAPGSVTYTLTLTCEYTEGTPFQSFAATGMYAKK